MNEEDVENGMQVVVYQSFIESESYKYSGMVLAMYRIGGVATFLTAMIAAIQDTEDYESYSPLRHIN